MPGQKYSNMQNKEEKNCIKVLMYKHLVEDLQFVSHELIVYCKKKKEDESHPGIHSKLESHQFYQTIIPLMLLRTFQRKTEEKKN